MRDDSLVLIKRHSLIRDEKGALQELAVVVIVQSHDLSRVVFWRLLF